MKITILLKFYCYHVFSIYQAPTILSQLYVLYKHMSYYYPHLQMELRLSKQNPDFNLVFSTTRSFLPVDCIVQPLWASVLSSACCCYHC